MERLEQDKQRGSKSGNLSCLVFLVFIVYITPEKYNPRSKQESDEEDDEGEDDDDIREMATALLYAKVIFKKNLFYECSAGRGASNTASLAWRKWRTFN